MQAQCRVAEQQAAAGADPRAADAVDGVRRARADPGETAEPTPESALQLARELGVAERDGPLGGVRARSPDDGDPAARQRQHGERTVRRETLERTTRRPRLRRAVDDQRVLAVTVGRDVDAEGRADLRIDAVGGDDEPRVDRLPRVRVLDVDAHALGVRTHGDDPRGREAAQPRRMLEAAPQTADETRVLHRVAERRDAFLARVDARRAEAPALADMDRQDRLGLVGRVPETELLEDPPRAVRERRRAAVETGLLEAPGLVRLEQHDVERQARERVDERRADEAAADDGDVGRERRAAHGPVPTSRSISSAELGNVFVSTSAPSFVTSTSSSIRMPMPRHRFGTSRSAAPT